MAEGLESLNNKFLTMFFGFQTLLSTLRLLNLNVYLQYKIIMFLSFQVVSPAQKEI